MPNETDTIEIDTTVSMIHRSIKRVSEMLAQIELLRIMNEEGTIDSDTRTKYADRIGKEGRSLQESELICEQCGGDGEVVASYSPNNPGLIDIPYQRCPECRGTGEAV